jgi:hypothetical protein
LANFQTVRAETRRSRRQRTLLPSANLTESQRRLFGVEFLEIDNLLKTSRLAPAPPRLGLLAPAVLVSLASVFASNPITPMFSAIATIVLASAVNPVPDVSPTSIVLGLGVLSLGVVARLLKNRKR